MKATITTTKPETISRYQFHSDDIHTFYDFSNGEFGEVLIDRSFIFDLHNKELKQGWDLARDLIGFLKTATSDGKFNSNMNVYLINNKIEYAVGYHLKHIRENLEEYEKYVDQREIETKIEFSLAG